MPDTNASPGSVLAFHYRTLKVAARGSCGGRMLACAWMYACDRMLACVQVPRQFSEGRDPAFDIGIITLDVNDTSLAYFTLPPGQDPLPAPTPATATAPAAAQPPSRTAVGSAINATAALIGGSAGTSAPTPDLALVPAAPGEKEGNRWAFPHAFVIFTYPQSSSVEKVCQHNVCLP